jgi:hypothetical protein
MPADWLYIIGGIVIGMLVFVIAYNLVTVSIKQAQEQTFLTSFKDFYTDIENVCIQEINNYIITNIAIPTSVRVLYVTDDKKNLLPTVVEKIKNKEMNRGRNLCMQFADEQSLRCQDLTCNTNMLYMGSLPENMDIKIMMRRILGQALVKEYSLLIVKTANGVLATTNITSIEEESVTTTSIKPATTTTRIATTTTSIPSGSSPDELANRVDVNAMMDNIIELTKNPRPYGSNWNGQTANYIKNKLESYGLENVHFEDFDSGGRNVVGEVGTGTNVIVVSGGHRDTCNDPPYGDVNNVGAVDNAAGTATVMEAARVLASCKNNIKNNKIRFVLFDGEEEALLGSEAYADQHYTEINRMLNFDCLGLKGNSGLTVFRTATDLSNSADRACQSLNINCDRKGQAPGQSDHFPFEKRGIEYLWVINYGYTCGSCYHRSCDDISKIGNTQMEWAGKFAVYVIVDLYLR